MKRLLLSCLVLSLANVARADVVYTTRLLDAGQVVSSTPESREFVSRDARLYEGWVLSMTQTMRESRLRLLKEHKAVVVNQTLGIAKEEAKADTSQVAPAELEKQTLTDLGEETVLGFKTHHYRIEYPLRPTYRFRTDTWLAFAGDLKDWPLEAPTISANDSTLTAFSKQSVAGLAVRTQTWASKSDTDPTLVPIYTEEVSSVAHIELEPSFYAVPTTVKMMSAKDYDEARAEWKRARNEEMAGKAAH